MKKDIKKMIEELGQLEHSNMFNEDFLLTWEKTDDELKSIYKIASILRAMREENISSKIFDSGLGISLFRDNSTRKSFAKIL